MQFTQIFNLLIFISETFIFTCLPKWCSTITFWFILGFTFNLTCNFVFFFYWKFWLDTLHFICFCMVLSACYCKNYHVIFLDLILVISLLTLQPLLTQNVVICWHLALTAYFVVKILYRVYFFVLEILEY